MRQVIRRRLGFLALLAIAQAGLAAGAPYGSPALGQASVPPPAATNPQAAGGVTSVALSLVGSTNLASPGLDGQVRPRGQNGDVATLKNVAYVGGGALFHGAQSTSGRVCTDYGGVKVVDLSNPARPAIRSIIDIEDTKGAVTGPVGNARRGLRLKNVSVSAGAVDALSFATSAFTGDVLAIATQRCEPSFFNGARIEFWDVSNPAAPTRLGAYDPELVPNPNCNPTCPGQQAATGAWGIFEDVRMFTRGNRVFAVATTPFSIGNSGGVSFFGDFRLLDVTDPRNPVQLDTFPPVAIGQDTLSGCRKFLAGRAAAPTPDGNSAILSFYDGSSVFEGNTTSAVFKLDLDNLPKFVPGSEPPRFNPTPAKFDYPIDRDVEVNAADVAPFTSTDGRLLVALSEDDIDPAKSSVTVRVPGEPNAVFDMCQQPMARKLYELPGQQLASDVVYVGRGCPASPLGVSTNQVADEYLADPRGRIALMDSGSSPFDGCSSIERAERAIAAGATAVLQNGGTNTLQSANNGPAGGNAAQPTAVVPTDAMTRMQLVPTVLPAASLAFPTTWERTTSTNVGTAPLASSVAGATNASPIAVTGSAHGLATGDRVAVAGVLGNTAANGTFTVTVTSPTAFTLDGSAGNGAYGGGGWVVRCPAGAASCTAPPTRTDFVRFRSVANAADPVARGQVNTANRFTVTSGQPYEVGATVQVESHTAGTFRTAVGWFDAAGQPLPESEIASLSAVTPRARQTRTVTAPAGAVRGAVKFEWTGAGAAGTAFVDSFTVVAGGLSALLKDDKGEWGAQRLLDFSANPPREAGLYRSPNSTVWPPPNDGLYGPRLSEPFASDVLFTTWLSDGLRVLDVSDPAKPREVAAFVPPDVADPSPGAGAGPTDRAGATGSLQRGRSWPDRALVTGVDVIPDGPSSGHVVVSDINAGLYVLRFEVTRGAAGGSYWSVASDGGVFAFGDAKFLGSTGGLRLARPVVGMAPTPSGNGYWLVASDGGVFAFGDARFLGSTGDMRLNQPIVGMAPTPTGNGYWLVASDGGVFAFGDARFLGSTGATRLARPIVGIAASPSGNGYRLVASDGGVFAFGDARFLGSTGAIRLARPVVGMASTPSGNGYWLVASDGGIFAFGDARFLGSTGATRLAQPVVGMSRSPSGNGYWLVASDGGVFAFGDARFQGSTGAIRLARPMVGIASVR